MVTTEQFILAEEGHDGLRADGAYKARWDAIGGCWSIGPGLTENVHRDTVLSGAEVLKRFDKELEPFEKAVDKDVKVPLNPNQRTALVSFAYNVGIAGFEHSSVLRLVNRGKFSNVPSILRQYVHGRATGSKVIQGLVNRRNAEIRMWNAPSASATLLEEAYVPLYDPQHPVPKFAVTLEDAMAAADNTPVTVPVSSTNLVINQQVTNAITAVQGGLMAIFGFLGQNAETLTTLKGTPAWLALIFAIAAQVWKSNLIKQSNDATKTLVALSNPPAPLDTK